MLENGRKIKISVGTKNPVKIKAVETIFKKIWNDVEIVSVDVKSGVNGQPRSDDETIEGATNRARLSLKEMDADFGIGLEGGIVDTKYGMFVSSWVVIVNKNGKEGIGSSGVFLLPEKVASEVRKGKELGPVIDWFVGGENISHKEGAVGIFTNNMINRDAFFERAIIYALTKFINPRYYENE